MADDTPDRDTAALLERMPGDLAAFPADADIHERRAMLRLMAEAYGPEPVPVAHIEPAAADGPNGPVPLRVYRPATDRKALPVLLNIHGGGWALGDPVAYERVCRAYCNAGECIVVDVDYRRAPEHKHPTALLDCQAALAWAAAHAAELGGDPRRIVVTGDSAGGNLAAALCQITNVPVALQILVYPVVDASPAADYPSRPRFGDGRFFLGYEVIKRAEREYLANPQDGEDTRVSPILADDATLKRLPPTLVVVAGLDPLLDEGVAYARRLKQAGVDTTLHTAEGTIHAFVLFAGAIEKGRSTIGLIGEWIKTRTIVPDCR